MARSGIGAGETAARLRTKGAAGYRTAMRTVTQSSLALRELIAVQRAELDAVMRRYGATGTSCVAPVA